SSLARSATRGTTGGWNATCPEACLALTNFTKEKPSDTAGGTIAFEVEDLDSLMTDLKDKGVTFKSDVIHSPVCRMAMCLDSEGNSILLHQLKPKMKPRARHARGNRSLPL